MRLRTQSHVLEYAMQFDEVRLAANWFGRCRELLEHRIDLGDGVRRHGVGRSVGRKLLRWGQRGGGKPALVVVKDHVRSAKSPTIELLQRTSQRGPNVDYELHIRRARTLVRNYCGGEIIGVVGLVWDSRLASQDIR